MDSIINSALGMVQRLAATIPTPTNDNDQSAHETLQQIITTEIATPQCILQDLLILTIIVVSALELLNKLVYHVPRISSASSIPVRGKHLDNFSWKDLAFIGFNKCLTGLFVYCYFGYLWSVRKMDEHGHGHNNEHHEEQSLSGHHHCCESGKGIWAMDDLSLFNTILPIPVLFFVYDFFYTLLHWFLHIKGVYAYVHKHHHHQKAPSRANVDAVNVHPLEFFLGEFNHIWALHLVVKGIPLIGFHGMDVSWLGATLFIGLGGVLAGLNHTRHNIVLSLPTGGTQGDKGGFTIFDSKHHDVHHRIPQSNYGQYTVAWDRIFGTFRDYDKNDRVNPAYQLDPATKKTIKSVKNE